MPENLKYKNNRKQELATGCTELIGWSKYDQKCMKVQEKHGKVTQIMHGASRNYRYVCDVSSAHAFEPLPFLCIIVSIGLCLNPVNCSAVICLPCIAVLSSFG